MIFRIKEVMLRSRLLQVANLGAGASAPQIPHFNTLPVLGKSQKGTGASAPAIVGLKPDFLYFLPVLGKSQKGTGASAPAIVGLKPDFLYFGRAVRNITSLSDVTYSISQ